MEAFWSGFIYTVIVILLLGVSVFVHEFGHFITAIYFKMFVETFSIGFGPAIWKKKIRGITYKIGGIPFGGYVALPQLDPAAMAIIQGSSETNKPLPDVAPWKKAIVVAAGPAGNIVFALLLAFIISWVPRPPLFQDEGKPIIGVVERGSEAELQGIMPGDVIISVNGEEVNSWYQVMVECALAPKSTDKVKILVKSQEGKEKTALLKFYKEDEIYAIDGIEKAMRCGVVNVMKGSPAEEAGIKTGDIIVSIDGEHVLGVNHFIEMISRRGGIETNIGIEREKKYMEIKVVPRYVEKEKRGMIGAMIGPAVGVGESEWLKHRKPFLQLKDDFKSIGRILKALITPARARQAASSLGGPVMIVMALVVSIKTSIINAVGFLRFLNVNLAVVNFLPFPILDGGHIMFALWEIIFRRKVSPKLVQALSNIFAIILIGVFILITYKDVHQRLPKIFSTMKAKNNIEMQINDEKTFDERYGAASSNTSARITDTTGGEQ